MFEVKRTAESAGKKTKLLSTGAHTSLGLGQHAYTSTTDWGGGVGKGRANHDP